MHSPTQSIWLLPVKWLVQQPIARQFGFWATGLNLFPPPQLMCQSSNLGGRFSIVALKASFKSSDNNIAEFQTAM